MLLRVVRDADARVLHGEDDVLRRVLDRNMHLAAGSVILDAVFDEVEHDLIGVVLKGENGAVAVDLRSQLDLCFIRQRDEHPEDAGERDAEVNDLVLDFGALGAVEREELLRHAREAVGLAANVGDEFAHRVGVHLVLQDGVGQELDGGQRRFQLVRSVGDKLALLCLGFLQPVGQFVEFRCKRGKLVRAAHLNFMAVFALAHHAHRGQNFTHAARAGRREEGGKQDDRAEEHEGTLQDRALEVCNDIPLLRVIVHQIDAAVRAVVIHDGDGGRADECIILIRAVEHIAAAQRLHHGRQEHPLADGVLVLRGIVDRRALGVRDDEARGIDVAKDGDDLLGRFRRERIDAGEGRGHDLDLVLRGGIFCAEHQLARGLRGEIVQQQQRKRCDEHVGQRIAEL